MKDDLEFVFNRLIDAFDDFIEARTELRQARGEYTGYSPSWALAS